MEQTLPPPIVFTIKYDGLTMGEHAIDLASLGESLQGFAKILATAGHFVTTGQYARQYSAQEVSVTTDARLSPGSIEILATIQAIAESSLFSGAAGAIFAVVVQRLLSRNDAKEMEHLAAALKEALALNKELAENAQRINERLITTVERMNDGLSAARREAMAPIGKSCKTITILDKDQNPVVTADSGIKNYWTSNQGITVTKPQTFEGRLTELDKQTGACKLSIDSNERWSGKISDPLLFEPGNVYLTAFAQDLPLRVTAKATLDKDGGVQSLYISDAELVETPESRKEP